MQKTIDLKQNEPLKKTIEGLRECDGVHQEIILMLQNVARSRKELSEKMFSLLPRGTMPESIKVNEDLILQFEVKTGLEII